MESPPLVNFLGYAQPPEPGSARIRLLPIPYDLTTTYQPGARRAPLAVLEASQQVEWFDEELGEEVGNLGIATLPPLEPLAAGPQAMVESIAEAAERWVDPERLLVSLGGEHSVTPPLVEAHRRRFPELSVLQIDAHADLRDTYNGSPHSHACAMRRVVELGVPLVQVGIRSLTRDESELLRSHSTIATVFAREIVERPARDWASRVTAGLSRDVYVTVDVDGLDPSVMPSTGTPEPGGLTWRQLVDLLALALDGRRCVGADVVELAPIPGLVAPDFLVARLLYRLMGLAAKGRGWLG